MTRLDKLQQTIPKTVAGSKSPVVLKLEPNSAAEMAAALDAGERPPKCAFIPYLDVIRPDSSVPDTTGIAVPDCATSEVPDSLDSSVPETSNSGGPGAVTPASLREGHPVLDDHIVRIPDSDNSSVPDTASIAVPDCATSEVPDSLDSGVPDYPEPLALT